MHFSSPSLITMLALVKQLLVMIMLKYYMPHWVSPFLCNVQFSISQGIKFVSNVVLHCYTKQKSNNIVLTCVMQHQTVNKPCIVLTCVMQHHTINKPCIVLTCVMQHHTVNKPCIVLTCVMQHHTVNKPCSLLPPMQAVTRWISALQFTKQPEERRNVGT